MLISYFLLLPLFDTPFLTPETIEEWVGILGYAKVSTMLSDFFAITGLQPSEEISVEDEVCECCGKPLDECECDLCEGCGKPFKECECNCGDCEDEEFVGYDVATYYQFIGAYGANVASVLTALATMNTTIEEYEGYYAYCAKCEDEAEGIADS